MPEIKKIALTGGPCAGKTTALVKIVEYFSGMGYKVFTIPEVPTLYSTGGWNYLTPNRELYYEGERAILETQLALEDQFYRLSEVFLMKAEAMSQLYDDEENLKEAFNYVREVFKRSNPFAYAKDYGLSNTTSTAKDDSLKFSAFSANTALENLVMAERQREFVCEGKRWFDLVRYAQRRGSTEKMLEFLIRKYSTNKSSIEAKLANMQSLFNPVYNNELKNNTWLYQNGVWSTSESTGRTDDL